MLILYKDTFFKVEQEDKDIVEKLSGHRYSENLEDTLVMSAKLVVLTALMKINGSNK